VAIVVSPRRTPAGFALAFGMAGVISFVLLPVDQLFKLCIKRNLSTANGTD
ncbi:unnamed protein product, partial [Acidithrix sp. C25]